VLPFRNQTALIREAVDLVCHPTTPESVLFCVPPGFGESELARQLQAALQEHPRRPAVARIEADQLGSRAEYLERLFLGWEAADVARPPPRKAISSAEFESYLGKLPRTRPFIQIVGRFHRLLDHLDQFILGSLRTAEQDCSIRSIILSYYKYHDLKKFWREHADKLTISNYGDKHRTLEALPLTRAEVASEADTVEPHVREYAIDESGGIPEVFAQIIRHSRDREWSPATRLLVQRQAGQVARGFIENLDLPGDAVVRGAIAQIHLGAATQDDYVIVANHPWREILLDGQELRARVVGREAFERMLLEQPPERRFQLGRAAYQLRRWAEAERILVTIGAPPAVVLLAHSRIMKALCGDTEAHVSLDARWTYALSEIAVARDAVRQMGLADDLLLARYDQLAQFTRTVHGALQSGVTRIVDALAGLDPRCEASPTDALLMLLTQTRTLPAMSLGRRVENEVMTRAMALPEQIFRVLAFWRLGLREDQAPAWDEELLAAWADVQSVWRGDFPAPPPTGQKFGSFLSFALFSAALGARKNIDNLPWSDLTDLHKQLSLFDVRRDKAHAIAYVQERQRPEYIKLVKRWMTSLFERSPVLPEGASEIDLTSRLEPLPCCSRDGQLEWMPDADT
jgi:hypothetical protein